MNYENNDGRLNQLASRVDQLEKTVLTLAQSFLAEQKNSHLSTTVACMALKNQIDSRRQLTDLIRFFADSVLPDWGHHPLKDRIALYEQADERTQMIIADLEKLFPPPAPDGQK